MAFPNDMQLKSHDAKGVTYASLADPNFTVRIKKTESVKSLDGVPVTNHACEIIINENKQVTLGTSPDTKLVNEQVSMRIRISGSEYVNSVIEDMIDGMVISLPLWFDQGVRYGFEPTTVPGSAV